MESDIFTLKVDSLAYGGRGVGRRSDGKVVFVPMVIPGETVRAKVVKEHSSFVDASAVEIIESSPIRKQPECSVFDLCGGCDWQHIAYQDQLGWKQDILVKEVQKGSGKSPEAIRPSVGSEKIYGYRRNARLQCVYYPELTLGFFRKRSHKIISFKRCPILNTVIQNTIEDLKEILQRYPVSGLFSLDIQAPQSDVLVQARCRSHPYTKDLNKMNAIYNALNVAGISFTMMGKGRRDYVFGRRHSSYLLKVRDMSIEMVTGFDGFMQANPYINQLMVEYVYDLAHGSRKILDLYSGSGNFSIPLACADCDVIAIDRSKLLVAHGRRNARINKIKNIRFLCIDSPKAVRDMESESVAFDTVILDPPREGAREVSQFISGLKAKKVIYISCNPSTLGRDVKSLISQGYIFKSIRLFDMFPHAYHIESVAYFEG